MAHIRTISMRTTPAKKNVPKPAGKPRISVQKYGYCCEKAGGTLNEGNCYNMDNNDFNECLDKLLP